MEPTRARGPVSSVVRSRALGGPSPSSSPLHPRAALRATLDALGARGIAPTARAIFAALWTHADASGRCWPSQATLARLTGRCERTVRSALHQLERARVIARDVPRLTERRRTRRTTAYLLATLEAPTSARAEPSPGAPRDASVRRSAPMGTEPPAPPAVDVSPVAARDARSPEAAPLARQGGDIDAPALDLEAPTLAFEGVEEVDLEEEPLEEQAAPALDLGAPPPPPTTPDAERPPPEALPVAPARAPSHLHHAPITPHHTASQLGAKRAPSPATTATPSPATVAARRPPREKAPPAAAGPWRRSAPVALALVLRPLGEARAAPRSAAPPSEPLRAVLARCEAITASGVPRRVSGG
jgi:hypothetical protein